MICHPRPVSSCQACPHPDAPRFERADAIGADWGNLKTGTFGEFLMDCEEDRTLRALLVGMLWETGR
jgi:hypothetical protein